MRSRSSASSRAPLIGAVGAVLGAVTLLLALDWALGRRATSGRPAAAVRSVRTISAPPEAAWDLLADLEGQVRWMHDAKAIRVISPGPPGIGTIAEADVRIFGLRSTDRIEVTAWDPPSRFAIRHLGAFRGEGEIVLEPLAGGTRVQWDERLVAPALPALFAVLARPVLARVFQADLDRFARLVESGGAEAVAR